MGVNMNVDSHVEASSKFTKPTTMLIAPSRATSQANILWAPTLLVDKAIAINVVPIANSKPV